MGKFKDFLDTPRTITRAEEFRVYIIGAFAGAILTIIILSLGFMR
jgi:uncharacterized membrane protein